MSVPDMTFLLPSVDAAVGGVMFAAADNFYVMLAVAIIAGISHWFQNRNKKPEDRQPWSLEDDDAPPPQHRTTPPPVPQGPQPQAQGRHEVDWEQELKRLLGEEPQPKPAAPPAPPPIIVARRTAQPPPIQSVVSPDEDDEDALAAGAAKLAPMRESASAHQRASSLQHGVEERFRRVDEKTEKHTAEFGRARPLAPAHAVSVPVSPWRNRAAARQAVVASVIFGAPKAMPD